MTSTTTPGHPPGTFTLYGARPCCARVRFGLGTSQRIWPALGVRAAYRVFGRRCRSSGSPPRAGGRASSWQREDWSFEHASLGVYLRTLPDEAPPICCWSRLGRPRRPDAVARPGGRRGGAAAGAARTAAHGRSAGMGPATCRSSRARSTTCGPARGARSCGARGYRAFARCGNALAYAASARPAGRPAGAARPPASPRDYTRRFAHVFGLQRTHARRRCSA